MDEQRFEELYDDLYRRQLNCRRGLVSRDGLGRFVRFVEAIEENLKYSTSYPRSHFAIRAALMPPTSKGEYDNHPYPPVAYVGPYTSVSYEEGTYDIQRRKVQTQWYELGSDDVVGIFAQISCCSPMSVSIASIAANAHFYLSNVSSDQDGQIVLRFSLPLEV